MALLTDKETGSALQNLGFDRSLVDKGEVWDSGDLEHSGRCAFCFSSESTEVATRADGLVIRDCAVCGLAYIDPRPSSYQLERYYREGYFTGGKKGFVEDYCLARDRDLQNGTIPGQKEVLENFELQGKCVLDVGCASGTLLCALRASDPAELVGIDTAEYPIGFGRERYGLDLRCTTLDAAMFPPSSFDLITLVDVIEHVEDLPKLIVQLRRALKPEGRIFLMTPNFAAYSLARSAWSSLYTSFEHLHYLSPASLAYLCRQSGLRLVKYWTSDQPFELRRYPKLCNFGLQRVVHPLVAATNFYYKLRYSTTAARRPDIGACLYAILQGNE